MHVREITQPFTSTKSKRKLLRTETTELRVIDSRPTSSLNSKQHTRQFKIQNKAPTPNSKVEITSKSPP